MCWCVPAISTPVREFTTSTPILDGLPRLHILHAIGSAVICGRGLSAADNVYVELLPLFCTNQHPATSRQ